jgi:hypothetical protein
MALVLLIKGAAVCSFARSDDVRNEFEHVYAAQASMQDMLPDIGGGFCDAIIDLEIQITRKILDLLARISSLNLPPKETNATS